MLKQGSQQKRSTALESILKEYVQTSTVAGLHFAFDRAQPKFGQVLWLALVIALTMAGIYTSVQSYIDWRDDPVVTTISSTGTPVAEVPFPSVIICSEGYNLENFWSAFWKVTFDRLLEGQYLSEINITPIRMLKYTNSNRTMDITRKEQETLQQVEAMLGTNWNSNPSMAKKLLGQEADLQDLLKLVALQLVQDPDPVLLSYGKELEEIMKVTLDSVLRSREITKMNETINFLRNVFQSYRSERVYKIFMTLLWFTNMPCSDIQTITSEISSEKSVLKSCKWKGQPINCSAIFKKVTTDIGICCAFNRESADKIYAESAYTSVLKELEDFENKNLFDSSLLPEWYLSNNEPNSQAGNQLGLSLVLDSHMDQVDYFSVSSDFQGFTAAVIPPEEFPMMGLSGFQVKPGHKNQVMLTAVKVKASSDIKSIDPIKRNCFFPDETRVIKLFKKYSQTNCFLECKLLYAERFIAKENQNKSSCTPWNFPFKSNFSRMCDPWEKARTLIVMSKAVPASPCSYCLPDCDQVIYQPVISTSKFRGCDMLNLGMTDLCSINSLGTNHNRSDHDFEFPLR